METYKTVIGSKRANEYLKLGWKKSHIFTKVLDCNDNGEPVNQDAAFVLVWDAPSEPVMPPSRNLGSNVHVEPTEIETPEAGS